MDIGFRTGGAQDASNFRERVAERLLPAPTDITYEGVVKVRPGQGRAAGRCGGLAWAGQGTAA